MIAIGLVLTGVAALIHVYIFVLESLAWTGARARTTFGTSPEEAAATKQLAFNQGFYNLFLAIGVLLGTVIIANGATGIGAALVFMGAGSMVSAGLVLMLSSRSKAAAALVQGVPPLLGIVALALGLAF